MKTKLVCIALGLGGLALGSVVLFFGLGFILVAVYDSAAFEVPQMLELPVMIMLPFLDLAGGLLFGWSVSSWYARRKGIVWNFGRRTRIAVWLVAAMYLLTWALGAPMVQSENTRWAVNEWKRINQDSDGSALRGNLPSMQTYVAVPILPFVVTSYHEYHLAGLYGAGGWDIQLWYLTGVKRVWFLDVWIS
jgi:hypothetical protein